MLDANCHGVGPDAFYDWEQKHGWRSDTWRDIALEYCANCLVRTECLTYALDQDPSYDWGVWGGTTREQRITLRRRRRATPNPKGTT